MKKLCVVLLALMLSVSIVSAQSDLFSNTNWTKAYQVIDYNLGTLHHVVGSWSVDRYGGASGSYTLMAIPSGAIVKQVLIDVIEPIQAVTVTNVITLLTAGDILASGTNNLTSTGVKAAVPVDTAGTSVKNTSAFSSNMVFTLTAGTAVTNGAFRVFVEYWKSNI